MPGKSPAAESTPAKSLASVRIPEQPVSAGSTANSGSSRLCAFIGPFENLAQGDILVERLAALEVSSRLQDVAVPTQKAYWVYLAPMVTREEALRLLSELQAQSIDSFVIPKGSLANGISLGLFNEKARAVARQRDIVSRGYAAQIKEELRTIQQSWVVADAETASLLGSKAWADLLDGLDEITYKQNYCPDVASLQ